MKDIIVDAIVGLSYDQIKYWINSIEKCGFEGDKLLICYNYDKDSEVIQNLLKKNFFVIQINIDVNDKRNGRMASTIRFYDLWRVLRQINKKYRYIIKAGARDVIFQKNPIEWIENNIGDKKIIASGENLISYFDEQSFPVLEAELYEQVKNNLWCNADTIAGEYENTLDLFLNMYLVAQGNMYKDPFGCSEQISMNAIFNLEPYKSIVKFTNLDDQWCAQLGNNGVPHNIAIFKNHFLVPLPYWEEDNGKTIVKNYKGESFYLVHAYDRVPELNEKIFNLYK